MEAFNSSSQLDQAVSKVTLRGETFHLEQEVEFVFGMPAMKNLVEIAPFQSGWNRLERRPKYEVKTVPRQKPGNVKEAIVQEREYKNIRTVSEDVAEFEYSPTACKKTYRMVVLRKNRLLKSGVHALETPAMQC